MKKHFSVLLIAVLSLFFSSGPDGAFAQTPGSLDLSFDPGEGANYVEVIVLQPDGRIVIGGVFPSYNGTPRSCIARINADGSLDETFDPGTGVAPISVHAIALQPDGRILIGGNFTSYNGTPRNQIARLNADGSLDETFDPGGGVGVNNNTVHTITIQSDGKIVIGGWFSSYNGTPRNNIARLNADGSLDETFDPGAGADNIVYSTIIQPDGRIVIGGFFTFYNGTPRNNIARLNADGSLDATFNPGSGANFIIYSTVLQLDGKIVIGGDFTFYNGTPRNYIARLNADGSLDTTFNPGSGANTIVYSTVLQPDGKMVIGGWFGSYNGTPRQSIARLNANGSLDETFNPDTGSVDPGGMDLIHPVAIQPDGKIVIGGPFQSYYGTPMNNIARLHGGATTGIGSVAPSGFSLFPNPASSLFTILMPEPMGRPELVLRNVLGQEMLRSTLVAGRTDIPVGELAPGLYSVQLGGFPAQQLVVE